MVVFMAVFTTHCCLKTTLKGFMFKKKSTYIKNCSRIKSGVCEWLKKLLCALSGRLLMDSSEGDVEVGYAVFFLLFWLRLCMTQSHSSRSPGPPWSSLLLLLLHFPQACESPHSSPSSIFRTPQHRRQNSDTHTLSDSVRWTYAL